MTILKELPNCKDCEVSLILLSYMPGIYEKWYCPKCKMYSGKLLIKFPIDASVPIIQVEQPEMIRDV